MAIDLDRILFWPFAERRRTYGWRDTVAYALSLGFGDDPRLESEIDFVFEDRLRALPTFCNVLPQEGNWLFDAATGVDASRAVHAGQSIRLKRPVPPEGTAVARTANVALEDKGATKGSILYTTTSLELAGGEPLGEITASVFLRGQGGGGGRGTAPLIGAAAPDRNPDRVLEIATSPQAAMLYRLNDDLNPLHIDPATARRAGFQRPILHGLCTMGIVQRALLRDELDYDVARVAGMDVRFSAPVIPGESLAIEVWRGPERIQFRAYAGPDRRLAIDCGTLALW